MVAATSGKLRERFANLDGCTYLVSHSMGAAPLTARDALVEFWEAWSRNGPEAWADWLPQIDAIADGIGRLIGAPAGSVGLAPNVSSLQATLASSFSWTASGPRDEKNEVVYEALQFPSLAYVWEAWSRHGARVTRVASDDGRTIPTERIVTAIGERTKIVVLSHAYFQSGALVDVPAVVARAKACGALVVLDVYQTAGVYPVDVTALDVDVAVGGSHKWLCGGPGCGFIYVRPSLKANFEPTATGWMAHRAPFAFDPPPMRYAEGMMRFGGGTPSVQAYLGARAGHRVLEEVGVANIRAANIVLTEMILAEADAREISSPTPREPARRTGWIGLDVADGERLAQELVARRIFVDYRPGCGIRVGPHFYTGAEEIAVFFRALDDLRN
ncbi:MAG: aminotransferase class V-fold PLP-dependent enzyme [Candidatus Eremiobacteraeota bacterium]|nr:aminotransferase class V-fold PLP-dependent enzyme [Candidatus Eremiobacteraeota bacterium]